MIYYIILELILIALIIINIFVIIKKKETKFLSRCQWILLISGIIIGIIIAYKSHKIGLEWRLDNSTMIGISLYTQLIFVLTEMFYWYTKSKIKDTSNQ